MDDLGSKTKNRKQDHININLNEDVMSSASTGFDLYYFEHNALPDLDLSKIEINCSFLGKPLKAPLLISSMTGGTEEGLKININLATAAQELGVPMGLGSQRVGLESNETYKSFNLRKWAPSIPIYANLGAIQLNYGYGIDECRRIVEMAQADALILHLNPLQEALQSEGQSNFSGLINKIESICKKLSVPVIIKEVGWGISGPTAKMLVNAGVSAIDIAGAGGTSWAQVEKNRNQEPSRARISSHFRDWGIPTVNALKMVSKAVPGIPIIASGGLHKGIDLAKSIALGASLGGMAGELLKAAALSTENVLEKMDEILLELRITMFAVGACNLRALKEIHLYKKDN